MAIQYHQEPSATHSVATVQGGDGINLIADTIQSMETEEIQDDFGRDTIRADIHRSTLNSMTKGDEEMVTSPPASFAINTEPPELCDEPSFEEAVPMRRRKKLARIPARRSKHAQREPDTPQANSAFKLAPPCIAQPNDLDLVLHHEDFPRLVAACAKLKSAKITLKEMTATDFMYKSHRPESHHHAVRHDNDDRKRPPTPDGLCEAVARMKTYVSSIQGATFPQISRGLCPHTDKLVDNSLNVLEKEISAIENSLQQSCFLQGMLSAYGASSSSSATSPAALGVKYAKWQLDVLMDWMAQHSDNPFPTSKEIMELSHATNLTCAQVVNWSTNVRKRNWKGTLNGKRPHHFMDFLFLAQERSGSSRKNAQPVAVTSNSSHDRKRAIWHV